MYKCEVCHKTSQPGQAKKKHYIYRSDGSIKDEVDLCSSCFSVLEKGVPFAELVLRHKDARDTIPPPAPWIGKSILDTPDISSYKPMVPKEKQPVKKKVVQSQKKDLPANRNGTKVVDRRKQK